MQGVLFRLRGRVQGVGFRWWARSRARELGVVGTVRNCDDGSVEILAGGPPAAIDAFRTELRDGPPTAVVEQIQEAPSEVAGFNDFLIKT